MEFRFQRGHRGVRQVPVVHMLGWRRVKEGPSGAVFRPGPGTVPYRLLPLALAVVLMLIAHFVLAPLMAERARIFTDDDHAAVLEMQRMANELGRELSDFDRERIEARAAVRSEEAERLRRQEETFRAGAGYAYAAIMVLLGVCGLLPLVSLAWNRVTIGTDAAGNLCIHRWGVLPKTHVFPLAAVGGIRIAAREHIERRSTGRYSSQPVSAGWRWRVRVDGTAGGPLAEFVLGHQSEQPRDGGRPPEPVQRVAEVLERLTGLACAAPTVEASTRLMPGPARAGESVRVQRSSYTTTIPLDDPAAWDALPPSMRAQVEAALRGESTGVNVEYKKSHRITVHDASGKVHHYESPEDMPPEMRALYERARKGGG